MNNTTSVFLRANVKTMKAVLVKRSTKFIIMEAVKVVKSKTVFYAKSETLMNV